MTKCDQEDLEPTIGDENHSCREIVREIGIGMLIYLSSDVLVISNTFHNDKAKRKQTPETANPVFSTTRQKDSSRVRRTYEVP